MKRVLVLYPGLFEERRKLLAPFRWRLRFAGVRLLLADERVHPRDRDTFRDVIPLPSPMDAAAAWDTLAGYLERNPVDALVAQSEPALLLGARAAREFGLLGPTLEGALATVDKRRSRTLLEEHGVAQPRWRLVRSAAEVRRFARAHGWPVVLKAVASSRQRLVTRVDREEDVAVAVAHLHAELPRARDVRRLLAFARLEGVALECDPTRDFLVESFARGVPVECDGLLEGERFRCFGTCEQLASPVRDFFIEGYLLPSRLDAESARRVEHVAARAARALGLGNTGVSIELRAGGTAGLRAPEEAARVIEVNGRLPWDERMEELVHAVTGHFPAVLALKLALGRRIGPVRPRRHGALLYGAHYAGGVVTRAPSSRELDALSGREDRLWSFTRSGARLLPAEHPDSRPHLCGVLSRDRRSSEAARMRASELLERIRFQVAAAEPEPGMKPGQPDRPASRAPDAHARAQPPGARGAFVR